MSETMSTIHRLAEERLNLYRAAAKTHLTPEQTDRLNWITNQLLVLWDEHRREVASQANPRPIKHVVYDLPDERAA